MVRVDIFLFSQELNKMARDTDALKIRKWAATGDRVDPDDSRISPRLNRAKGWPASFSQAGGDVPRREVFNQIFAEITGMLHEINQRGGILEHSPVIDYQHPAIVARNDGQIFISRRTNGPSTNNAGAPPTGTTSQNTNWKNLLSFISIPSAATPTPDATTTVKGKIEISTISEATTGTDTVRAVTPAGLQAGLDALQVTIQAIIDAIEIPDGVGAATTTKRGTVELATVTEADNQTDAVRAVTPVGLAKRAKLASPTFTGSPKVPTAGANENSTIAASTAWVKARIAGIVSNATTSARGIVELATVTEADNQSDAVRAVTPAGLASRAKLASPTFTGSPKAPTPGSNDNSTRIPTTAWVRSRLSGLVRNASTTARGIVELATVTEAKNGTDTERAVTPAGLKAATGNARETWLYWNNSGIAITTGSSGTAISVPNFSGYRLIRIAFQIDLAPNDHYNEMGLPLSYFGTSRPSSPINVQSAVNIRFWRNSGYTEIRAAASHGNNSSRVYAIIGVA